ncbi:FtsK/SpoIIIE family DNA translocase [Domibacillus enclensis]|uniref:DNA translocase FtsK n=1 Tax=Domibacillus enclensis TaxID=1017273 RepID=A0A1N6URR8_9BACI|nr:DNA translocase FtsK [Domibacillus enclensis]OXS78601.1 DNA translocase FtsK [Domibacillus enclensis]SIQ68182.1 DNA translocase FtsK [Domibacillus enclensis]
MAQKNRKKPVRRRTNKEKKRVDSLKIQGAGVLLLAVTAIGLLGTGAAGEIIKGAASFFFGALYAVGLIGIAGMATFMIIKKERPPIWKKKITGLLSIIASVLLLLHIRLFANPSEGVNYTAQTWQLYKQNISGISNADIGGGMAGGALFHFFFFLFGRPGTWIFMVVLFALGVLLIGGKPLMEKLVHGCIGAGEKVKEVWHEKKDQWAERKKEHNRKKPAAEKTAIPVSEPEFPEEVTEQAPVISSFAEKAYADEPVHKSPKETQVEKQETEEPAVLSFTEEENTDYQLPPFSILQKPQQADQSNEKKHIQKNAQKLEKTFQSFGVKAKVVQIHLGPAVTKYEVQPDTGVKVSKIVGLTDDLALALAAKDIRMEAPIPGKSAIGIEVPNAEVAMVSFREVIEAKQHEKKESKLMAALGRDITGEAIAAELNKMPHLLVAGATGSGKSVCINGIITSILMRAKPHEVKMMMIDPKMVELNVYNGVPHLLAPVVTDAKKASQALKKVVGEMERRYDLFSHTGTRNIEGYNGHVTKHNNETGEKQPHLPYIVVIVDELADLMMVASNDVEDSITRLAQMARAAGIHLIIATQRPSVDVITGVIKANIPSRIAFSVSSATDSRTILDMGGAEKLLGRGDMLFYPSGAVKPIRVQGAFLSDEEVEDVVDFVISQQKAQYQEEMIPEDIPETTGQSEDELYDEAVQLISEMQTASVSMLQRRFRIGYSRAARLIDEMEMRGVIGPYEGSKPRTVLLPKPSEDQV